jgi:bacterioferritin-associated ferredoxin
MCPEAGLWAKPMLPAGTATVVPERGPAVDLDDDLCLCFHVTKRKVVNFLRITRPRRVGQLSECFGAGTGCGWCRPYLQQLFDQAKSGGDLADADLPTAVEYAAQRKRYRQTRDADPPCGEAPP